MAVRRKSLNLAPRDGQIWVLGISHHSLILIKTDMSISEQNRTSQEI